MATTECLCTIHTIQPVDSVASIQLANFVCFVIASYELVDQKRIGSIQIGLARHHESKNSNNDSKNDTTTVSGVKLFAPQNLEFGVLDVKLIEDGDDLMIFGMGSDCAIHVFRLRFHEDGNIEFNEIMKLSHKVEGGDAIGLALDVHKIRDEVFSIWSSSDGTLCHHSSQNKIQSWHGHDAQVWSVGFDPHSHGRILASGGDDCNLKIWDLRNLGTPIDVNSKTHTMGVTVATFDPIHENNLITGSYDENIRIWDRRILRSPVKEFQSSGGIWRLKFENWGEEDARLLVAATQGGCQVFSVSPTSDYSLLSSHHSHESMVYGISSLGHKISDQEIEDFDYSHKISRRGNKNLYISGSFYDQCVSFWDT